MVTRRKKPALKLNDVTQVSGTGRARSPARKRAVVARRTPSGRVPDPPAAVPRLCDEGEIAVGGMGAVRKVFDTILLRHVAMKVMASDLKNDFDARERFLQEAQITAQLEHPNIVPLYDAGQLESVGDYAILKLVRGRTLSEELAALQKSGRATEEDLLGLIQILLKVCDAIAFAHSRSVVHRDLKPSNVMIGEYGQVYVVDWGVAIMTEAAPSDQPSSVRVSARLEGSTAPVGTRGYMAPEQAQGHGGPADKRSDVYALGAILYEVLTGHAPPANDDPASRRHPARNQPLPFPSSSPIWPRLPPALGRIAMRALAPRPQDRYPNIEGFKRDLDEFVAAGDWFETRTFQKGQTIVAEGAPGDAAYIIISGACEVRKRVDGKEQLIRTLGPGDVFGETAIFFSQPRSASVVAGDEVVVKIVTKTALEFEMRKSPWFGAFVRALAARFAELDRRIPEPSRPLK